MHLTNLLCLRISSLPPLLAARISMDVTNEPFVLPGLMPRKEFAQRIGRCERTVKRLEDAGKVVTVPFGSHRLVDVEKTLARLRGGGTRRGRPA
jgi:hypothetical protein